MKNTIIATFITALAISVSGCTYATKAELNALSSHVDVVSGKVDNAAKLASHHCM